MSVYNSLKEHASAQSTHDGDRYVQVQDKNGIVVSKNEGYYCIDDSESISSASASTAVSSTLAGTQVDFKIEPSSIDLLYYPILRAEFLNSSGSNCSRNSLHSEIQRLDVLNSKGDVLWTTNGQEMFLANTLFMDRNTYEGECAELGLTSAFAQLNTVVADAGTQVLVLPIYGFFKACKIYIEALSGAITLRFYFNPSTYTVVTGAQMTCTSLILQLNGKSMKTLSKQKIEQTWRNEYIPVSLSHLSCDRIQHSLALAASTQYKINLQGLTGVCALIVMSIRLASTANTTAQYTCLPIQLVDVLDGSNASLGGSYQRPPDCQRVHHAHKFGNNSANLGLTVFNFCGNPIGAFSEGQVGGFRIITGTESIQFTTKSTLASATYLIDIRAYQFENLLVHNGMLKTSRV